MAEHTSQVVGATLIGGLLGAGLALLIAPRSGKETRERIQENVNNMKGDANTKLEQARSRVHQGIDEAKDLKERLADAAHNTGKKAKSELGKATDKTMPKANRQSPVLSAWEEEV